MCLESSRTRRITKRDVTSHTNAIRFRRRAIEHSEQGYPSQHEGENIALRTWPLECAAVCITSLCIAFILSVHTPIWLKTTAILVEEIQTHDTAAHFYRVTLHGEAASVHLDRVVLLYTSEVSAPVLMRVHSLEQDVDVMRDDESGAAVYAVLKSAQPLGAIEGSTLRAEVCVRQRSLLSEPEVFELSPP